MHRRLWAWSTAAIVCLGCASAARAQLPSDAVDLAKVKIPEKQKSEDLCPVHLVKSDPSLPTWEHDGVTYRGSTPESQAEFAKSPDKYAKAAARQRWENNFVQTMSVIWCPVTDEVNPGGGLQWEKLGLTWESCCRFCDEDVTDEDFPDALKRLKERAQLAYKATGGKYVEGAKSPVEGAIRMPGEDPLVGTWKLTLTASEDRTFENTLTFAKGDDGVSAAIKSRLGDVEAPDAGVEDGDKFAFTVTRERDGAEIVSTYRGQLVDGKLQGEVDVEFNERQFTLKLSGVREHSHDHDHKHGEKHEGEAAPPAK